jgi:(p)ppGpp synthase/HD superfamily hydrolase
VPKSLPQDAPALLGPTFERALVYAARLHRRQLRKGGPVPYEAHLLAVASLVLEDGGSQAEAIAALLHDAVEDQGGAPRAADIKRRFGSEVADIVAGCTETDETPKPPWRARKELYLAHLAEAPTPVLRVALADKVHNARCLVSDLDRYGSAAWQSFNAGPAEQIWWYQSLARLFASRHGGPQADELARLTARIAEHA